MLDRRAFLTAVLPALASGSAGNSGPAATAPEPLWERLAGNTWLRVHVTELRVGDVMRVIDGPSAGCVWRVTGSPQRGFDSDVWSVYVAPVTAGDLPA